MRPSLLSKMMHYPNRIKRENLYADIGWRPHRQQGLQRHLCDPHELWPAHGRGEFAWCTSDRNTDLDLAKCSPTELVHADEIASR